MLTERDLDFLRGLSVFAGLGDDVLAKIGEHAQRVDFVEDRLLYREGEPATEMAVVLTGHLEVRKRADTGTEFSIATLGPGDVAGEMPLIDIQPRSANLHARAPVSLAVLRHSDLTAIYREDKQAYALLVRNIAREISIRLRRLDAALANIMDQIQAVTRGAPLPEPVAPSSPNASQSVERT